MNQYTNPTYFRPYHFNLSHHQLFTQLWQPVYSGVDILYLYTGERNDFLAMIYLIYGHYVSEME